MSWQHWWHHFDQVMALLRALTCRHPSALQYGSPFLVTNKSSRPDLPPVVSTTLSLCRALSLRRILDTPIPAAQDAALSREYRSIDHSDIRLVIRKTTSTYLDTRHCRLGNKMFQNPNTDGIISAATKLPRCAQCAPSKRQCRVQRRLDVLLSA